MLSSFLFICYIIIFCIVCFLSFTKTGLSIQQEFLAWRATKRFYTERGIKWPDLL